MKTVFSSAPLRLSFAGGGSDIEPFCSEYGGAVLNACISKYVYAEVSQIAGPSELVSLDTGLKESFIPSANVSNQTLSLHRQALEYFLTYFGGKKLGSVRIRTFSESPPSSGLGSSSSLMVAIVAGLAELGGETWTP